MFDVFRVMLDFWWLAPLAGAGLVAYRLLGWRGLLAVATLGLAGGIYTKGKRDQRDAGEREAEANRLRSVRERKAVENEIAKDTPTGGRDRLREWVQRDDPPR